MGRCFRGPRGGFGKQGTVSSPTADAGHLCIEGVEEEAVVASRAVVVVVASNWSCLKTPGRRRVSESFKLTGGGVSSVIREMKKCK